MKKDRWVKRGFSNIHIMKGGLSGLGECLDPKTAF